MSARSPEALARQIAGLRKLNAMGNATRRRIKEEGMAAAREWRESRRCKSCGALAFESCAHRPNGLAS